MTVTVDYFLALASPWTYLAGPRLAQIVADTGAKVVYKPFDIMGVFKTNGTKPVGERPKPVQINRLNELARWRDFLGMPLNVKPKYFPVNPTPSGRMVIAAQEQGGDAAALADAYLRAVWAEERDIAEPATIVAIANEQGFDGAALRAQAEADATAAIFQRNTEEAVAHNVFGAPTWIVGGELFWGQDRLDFVRRAVEATA